MDKARTHEKQPEVSSKAKKGNSNRWHGDMFKRSTHESDFPAQPYIPSMPLPYSLRLWPHPMFPNLAYNAMPQYPLYAHEQETFEEGQQDRAQTCSSDRSDSPEMPSPNTGTGCHPHQSASSEPSQEDSHVGEARMRYNYPSGFAFPTQYPGQPDPLMLWMHQMQRQVAYLYSMSRLRNGYQQPIPMSSNGANQRGFIKIPAGISQKQSHLWEAQSTENMQLWATVTQLCATIAKAEAEIFCQHDKIIKLEDDLRIMKARQDAMSETLKSMRIVSPRTKQVRRKRTATAPVAILGLPASQAAPRMLQIKKARGHVSESETLKVLSCPALEERCEETQLNGLLSTSRTIQDKSGGPLLAAILDRKESQTDVPSEGRVETQLANTVNACGEDVVARQESQDSCIRSSVPPVMMMDSSGPQNVRLECGTKVAYQADRCNEGAVSVECTGRRAEGCLTGSVTKQVVSSGDCNTEGVVMNRSELCITENRPNQVVSTDCSAKSVLTRTGRLEGVVGRPMEGSTMHFSSVMERPSASSSGTLVAGASDLSTVQRGQEYQWKYP